MRKANRKVTITTILSASLGALAIALTFLLKPTWAFFAAVLGLGSGLKAIFEIKRSKSRVKSRAIRALAIANIVFPAVLIILLSYWRIDAPPIPNDYTISDISSAAPQFNHTYELLKSLADKDSNAPGAPAIGLTASDVNALDNIHKLFDEADYTEITAGLTENADAILLIWQNAEKGRSIIAELSTYPEIADLTEPRYARAAFTPLKNLRPLVYLHQAYICLQSCQGNEETALNELAKWNSFVRKMNLNARSLITKLVCIAALGIDIQTANFIINNPQTSQPSLHRLASDIPPFTREDFSQRNSVIFEYLAFRNELRKVSQEPRWKYSSFSPLKLNSSFRVHRNFCDVWIALEENQQETEKFSVWPRLYPDLPVPIGPNGHFPWYYKAYNPVGSALIGILLPGLDKAYRLRTSLQVHSDLLHIVLCKRLGREVSLKARAYSDEYIIDLESKKIFSPGPDGIPHTKDDIKLIINPDVLNWTEQPTVPAISSKTTDALAAPPWD